MDPRPPWYPGTLHGHASSLVKKGVNKGVKKGVNKCVKKGVNKL